MLKPYGDIVYTDQSLYSKILSQKRHPAGGGINDLQTTNALHSEFLLNTYSRLHVHTQSKIAKQIPNDSLSCVASLFN